MRSFEHGYLFDTPISHSLLMAMRSLGEFRGRQVLYCYEVGRYISLERIVEESKETYYEALLKSSRGWHEGEHDLRPWWNYFVGMLTAAYKEFEVRVGTITSARGAKREMVRDAIGRMTGRFSIDELRRVSPGVSYPTLQRALADLRRDGRIRSLGRGPNAKWEVIRS
jgi:hypothetical protein